jgi:predicted nucleic acid-binding protein
VIILFDAGPLGLLSNPSGRHEAVACLAWLESIPADRAFVCISEIADYEVRRELLRHGSLESVARLDELAATITFLTIDTATMRRAAQLWAESRNRGRPTADPAALDADVILAAQAQLLHEATDVDVVVATANIRHLGQFVNARRWQDIQA